MSDVRELYQQVILDHYRSPRNRGVLEGANRHAEGHNPLCGDRVRVSLRLEGEVVAEVRFDGAGCAISTAAASLMTEAVRGKTVGQTEELFRRYREMLTAEGGAAATPAEAIEELGKLAVLAGVRDYPVRVKCATLAWHTLQAALQDRSEPVSTEE